MNWLDSDRDRTRLHERLHVPHYDIFGRPQVPELAIDDAAVIRCSHTLCVSLLRIDHECARPEMHIVQNGASFDKPAPVHVFEDADAVHCDYRAETESDESDCSSLYYVRFEKENGQQAPAESSLIIGEDELLLTGGKDVDDVEELLDTGLLFAVEYAFVEEVKRIAGGPFERKNFCMLEEG